MGDITKIKKIYIDNFRYMWEEIARQSKEEKRIVTKEDFFKSHSFIDPVSERDDNLCYCCEFDRLYGEDDCENCPINFGKTEYSSIWTNNLGACNCANSPYSKLSKIENDEQYEIYSSLALEVSKLPERRD